MARFPKERGSRSDIAPPKLNSRLTQFAANRRMLQTNLFRGVNLLCRLAHRSRSYLENIRFPDAVSSALS